MASQYFGLNRGQEQGSDYITTGTSTGSTDIELRVDLAKNLTRKDIATLTRKIIRFIEDGRTTTLKL